MATGNLLLGLGRKSIGDITLYRTRGQQRARARVRQVANPRSYKQLLARAVVGSVARLYSAGKEIFNHSFQGYAFGQENQLRYQKLNTARLRKLLVHDFDGGVGSELSPEECLARIGARDINVAVPFVGLQVSEGGYQQRAFVWSDEDCFYELPLPLDGETVSQYCTRVGLMPQDIYTLGGFDIRELSDIVADFSNAAAPDMVRYHRLYQTFFAYAQLMVKDSVSTDETVLTPQSLYSVIFDFYGGVDLTTHRLDNTLSSGVLFGVNEANYGGIFLIRSKYNTDLRSTSYIMQSNPDGMMYGLTINDLEAAWGDSAGLEQADYILEGVNF